MATLDQHIHVLFHRAHSKQEAHWTISIYFFQKLASRSVIEKNFSENF